MKTKRIVVIGAGPIGLEAALYAAELGYQVSILEKGTIGHNIRQWGHVTLFSPWKMNHSPLGVSLLRRHDRDHKEPGPEDFLTGREYVEAYLLPLSRLPRIAPRIQQNIRVETIGRADILKGDLIGDSARADHPFRILTRDATGKEGYYEADVVIDATGVYDNPNWLGRGGIPAIGERKYKDRIDYNLKDVYGCDRAKFAGKRTLLVGSGYSAATAVCDFQNLIREEPETSLVWASRSANALPVPPIEDDPLPNRAKLTAVANGVARDPGPGIDFRNNSTVDSVEYIEDNDSFTVELHCCGATESIRVDRILALVGYGPDNSLYRELQIHECYASRGPMKLAAALLGSSTTDCLQQTSMGAETLKNPEPNFYIIGNKSYGRDSTFLIRTGLGQIVEAFSLISGDSDLNLYERIAAKEPVLE